MPERLDTLEQTVANLARELRELRAVVDRLAANGDTSILRVDRVVEVVLTETSTTEPFEPSVAGLAAGPPARDPAPSPPWYPASGSAAPLADAEREAQRRASERRSGAERRSLDLEALIGRYGTLALASLTILLGAGAFLSWAIAHGKIGPGMRVFLGAVGAAVVAVVGWRLRSRGSKRFGSTLLALALALVHVDAWGAGPYLQLVPSPVALGVAAAASIALAVLAWLNDEEALFSVGVGGALLAPFVTSREPGSVIALLIYGYVVLACGLAALRGRAWRTAVAVTTAGCWVYTATAAGVSLRNLPAYAQDYPAMFALAIAWTALLLTQGTWGARIARSAIVALLGTLTAQAFDRAPAMDLILLAAIGTATAYATVYVAGRADAVEAGVVAKRQPLFTAALLPLALGGIAVVSARDTTMAHTLVALVWTAAAVAAAYLLPAGRPTHLMVGGITSGLALLFALESRDVPSCIALSAHAAALSLLLRRERTRLLAVPIALGLVALTVWTFNLLSERPIYQYTPFLTAPSFAALAMAAAWLVVSWNASRVQLIDAGYGTLETRTAVRLAGAVVTFMWGNTELSHAYSSDVSTFLLILYYAVVGVAAIFIGRHRAIRVLRHAGLGLAIFAALKAMAEASSLAIGWRVGSYFLAGLFLLAVAYWYRDRDAASASPVAGVAPKPNVPRSST